jgi:calmodulin
MREGNRGRTFYILADGEVEICQRTQYDPLVTADSYLGSVINRLGPGDYFGERSLLTGEPRAASIRASERTTCIVFDRDDFPASSILSGKTRNVNGLATSLETANDKYGVALSDLLQLEVMQQIRDASSFSQTRGSPNSPKPIMGVDTEEEELSVPAMAAASVEPGDGAGSDADASVPASFTVANKEVMALLSRFQMIRHVSQCLDYLEQMRIKWGDEGSRLRRSILVNRLPVHQKRQFRDTFQLIDVNGDGTITLMELKQVMSSIGETKSDEELRGIFISGREMTEDDFLGIMAEAEFYTLFRDIFVRLDPYDTGFVRARDLDRVLCGVRDLISDDRKSIIDVEDDEMLIDYEQFSRMLLGSALA